jgi:hypothetical protein
MTLIARLTWQSAEPARLSAALGARLGVAPVPERDGFALPLGTATLEVVPWRPEHAADSALVGGRLVFEPVWDAGDISQVLPGPSDPLQLAGVAWSTVELDRAERDLGMWLEPDEAQGPSVADPLLGATTRVRSAPGLPGGRLVLSEPSTEGRLAASLARDGEGPCALYLRPVGGLAAWCAAARTRRAVMSRRELGPVGPQVLALGGPVAGPHLLVVESVLPSSGSRGTGTIDP